MPIIIQLQWKILDDWTIENREFFYFLGILEGSR